MLVRIKVIKAILLCLLLCIAACERMQPKPYDPSTGHIGEEDIVSVAETDIPDLVNSMPMAPAPTPPAKLDRFTVVVNQVPIQEFLFALARETKVNVDIDPKITGKVTLNAIDQTLPEILDRISRQLDILYEYIDGDLVIRIDQPYLKTYQIDYVNIRRVTDSTNVTSTQITSAADAVSINGGNSNSTTKVDSASEHDFWKRLAQTVSATLGLEPKTNNSLIFTSESLARLEENSGTQDLQNISNIGPTQTERNYWEQLTQNVSVIPNPEAGVLIVRATQKQHEMVKTIIEQIMDNAKRQVLIQITIVEVTLNNKYQAGVDWGFIKQYAGELVNISSNNIAGAVVNNALSSFVIDVKDTNQSGFSALVKLLDEFGNARILSSPQIMVLNNHTALLKVVENRVYFEVNADTTISGSSGTTNSTVDTTAKTVPVGIVMVVSPQIDKNRMVTLNIRPTISRQIGQIRDPNPELARNNIENLIPEIAVREMESMLRLADGQIGVLGGLMQDSNQNKNAGIPGLNRDPLLGTFFKSTAIENSKTELVIFIRPLIIDTPSINSDLQEFKDFLNPQQISEEATTMTGESMP